MPATSMRDTVPPVSTVTRNGRFIAFEGIEGAGKSTQIQRLAAHLRTSGQTVFLTREPGGTPLGERLRAILLDPATGPLTPAAELLLLFAARAEHLAAVIRPHLAADEYVLCDRFTDASYAYQGAGRRMGAAPIAMLEDWVQGPLRPDLVLVLDLPVAVGLDRVRQRGAAQDRIETEALAFFSRARAAYLERAQQYPARYRVIDASADPDRVAADVAAAWEDWQQQQRLQDAAST